MTSNQHTRDRSGFVGYTVVVFVVLASLDNAALAVLPSMLIPVSDAFGVQPAALGWVTAAVIFITAVTAVGWGFWGDRTNRKNLLIAGTVIWASCSWATAGADSLAELAVWQMLMAVGLGTIASVGFSVISDFIAPSRRGLAMSFWGISQGAGTLAGGLMASQLGAVDWQTPFRVIGIVGLVFAAIYATTLNPRRGRAEPELAGIEYDEVISAADIPQIFRRRTNLWLIVQGVTAQLAYGSLIWVPLLYQAKVLEQGYDAVTATRVGGIYAAMFQVAAVSSIAAGWLGDRWQRRDLRGRAFLSMIGVLGAIPFFLAFFFVPLTGLDVQEGASSWDLALQSIGNLASAPLVGLAFGLAVVAAILTSADSPNWFALISDVNLPEHRGTVFGLGNFANGMGRFAGNWLTGITAASLITAFAAPLNYAIALAMFQVGFLPTGYAYWKASTVCETDIESVRSTLRERARQFGRSPTLPSGEPDEGTS